MTMYLDDTLTEQELTDTRDEMRHHSPAAPVTYHGEAIATLLTAGDIIGIYAGNTVPSHAVTVESTDHDDHFRTVTLQTTGGEYVVPDTSLVWVCAYAPLLGD